MTLEQTQEILNKKKRGQYLTITFRKVLGDFVKTTTTTIRLVNYNNVKAVKEKKALKGEKTTITSELKNTPKKPSADKYLGNNLIYNENTGKTRLQVFLTNHHKPHCVYEYQGQEITQDEWYAESGDKKSTHDIMFTINIENIIAIK